MNLRRGLAAITLVAVPVSTPECQVTWKAGDPAIDGPAPTLEWAPGEFPKGPGFQWRSDSDFLRSQNVSQVYLRVRNPPSGMGRFNFLVVRFLVNEGLVTDPRFPEERTEYKDTRLWAGNVEDAKFDFSNGVYDKVILPEGEFQELMDWCAAQNGSDEFYRIVTAAQPNLRANDPAADTIRKWRSNYPYWPQGEEAKAFWLPCDIPQNTRIFNLEAVTKQGMGVQVDGAFDPASWFHDVGALALEYNIELRIQAIQVWADPPPPDFPKGDGTQPPDPARDGGGYVSVGVSNPLEYTFDWTAGGRGNGKAYDYSMTGPDVTASFTQLDIPVHFQATGLLGPVRALMEVSRPGAGMRMVWVQVLPSGQGPLGAEMTFSSEEFTAGDIARMTQFENALDVSLIPREHQDVYYLWGP